LSGFKSVIIPVSLIALVVYISFTLGDMCARSLLNLCQSLGGAAVGQRGDRFFAAGLLTAVRVRRYGVSLAALGMLSNLATCLTIDVYGPVCDNAGALAAAAPGAWPFVACVIQRIASGELPFVRWHR
jgi:Na+/H+-translocating membrane pyrophosphatase